jgi:hypothetical protein
MRGRQTFDPSRPHESRTDYWGVVLDAPDPQALIRFYAELLEWRIVKNDPEWATATPPEGATGLAVQKSPTYERPTWPDEAGKQQMMMHLDIEVDDLDTAVAHATELGAAGEVSAPGPRTSNAGSSRPPVLPVRGSVGSPDSAGRPPPNCVAIEVSVGGRVEAHERGISTVHAMFERASRGDDRWTYSR